MLLLSLLELLTLALIQAGRTHCSKCLRHPYDCYNCPLYREDGTYLI
ncbi:hypothetical protein [Pectobacterium phage Mimer]